LKGRTQELVTKIRGDMETAAAGQEYEKAARLRDKLFALQRTTEKQVAVTTTSWTGTSSRRCPPTAPPSSPSWRYAAVSSRAPATSVSRNHGRGR